jgi:hypothetical protein
VHGTFILRVQSDHAGAEYGTQNQS